MIIRKLQREDLKSYQDTILELLIDTYSINFQLSREQCRTICKEKQELLDGYIKQGSAIVVGAINDDTLTGFLWLYKHDFLGEPRLHINQIAVSIRFRGKGIGKQLIQEAEKQAKLTGIETIDLFVSETNAGVVNMYIGMGYETERRYMKKSLGGKENVINNLNR